MTFSSNLNILSIIKIDIPYLKKEDDLEICNYPYLERIIVKENSFKHLNSLKICNNELLNVFEIEEGDWDENSTFRNVKNVILESI